MTLFQSKILITFIVLYSVQFTVYAQYQSRGKEYNFTDAEHFFSIKDYFDALPLYAQLASDFPKVSEYKFKKGICNLELNDAVQALEDFKSLQGNKKKPKNYNFYLARAHALNYEFDKAIELFTIVQNDKSTDEELKKEIPHLIEQCKNGKELMANKLDLEIKNLGQPINSINNEYSPVLNADETMMAFTYRGVRSTGGRMNEFSEETGDGKYYEDVFITRKYNGKWDLPQPIKGEINSKRNEATVAMSSDGQILYIYRDTKFSSGDLFFVKKTKDGWSEMEELPVNSEYWEGSISVSPNGKTAIFSSDRPGGIGGVDLYIIHKLPNGEWSEPKNMGETINTKYDDDSPFIYSDGISFNFCSKGHNSMGGFDIFESRIVGEGEYLKPRNIGYPLNTTAHDLFFFVTGGGNAYFSSTRPGGKGQSDIYEVDASEVLHSKPVVLVKGNIIPENCIITVKNKAGEDRGSFRSDAEAGKYQFYLNLGEEYEITFKLDAETSKTITIDTRNQTEYTEHIEDIIFIIEDERNTTSKPKMDLSVRENFDLFVERYGKQPVEDVYFQVQVGAFMNPDNFNTKRWKKFGKLTKVQSTDGITRFRLGNYETFEKAQKVVDKARKVGDKDAFILVFYKGERTSLNKLIEKGVYKF